MTAKPAQRRLISPAGLHDAERLADWCLRHASATSPPEAGADRADRRQDALIRCIEHGCALVASRSGQMRGVAALDLDRALIAELTFAADPPAPDLVGDLLAAIERLAVRYGFDELALTVPAGRHEPFIRLGYRIVDRAGGAANATLQRSLHRRQTNYARRVRAIAAELGIPADYARRHRLPLQPEARRLSGIGRDIFGREQRLAPRAARAWHAMVAAAARDGIALQAVSAFRTVDYQHALVTRKLASGQRIEQILRVTAAPGFSEHHTGRAVDLTTPGRDPLEEDFERTAAFAWLTGHARTHGFHLSFPRDNRHGIAYEPWHWRYRG